MLTTQESPPSIRAEKTKGHRHLSSQNLKAAEKTQWWDLNPRLSSASINQLLRLQPHLVAGTRKQGQFPSTACTVGLEPTRLAGLQAPISPHPPHITTDSTNTDDGASCVGVTHHQGTAFLVLAKAVASPGGGGAGGHLPERLLAVLQAIRMLQVLQRHLRWRTQSRSLVGASCLQERCVSLTHTHTHRPSWS